jgi:uncharacterized protein (TIGR03118 family)
MEAIMNAHARVVARCCVAALLSFGLASATSATPFGVINLVTDDKNAHPAMLEDASLVNAWGISRSPTSPFWVSANGTGVTTLYTVNSTTNAPTKVALTVTIPGIGNVTGQVFNPVLAAFNGDAFLFVSEDGTISGWRGALGATAEVLQTGSATNVYKGTTLASIGGNTYLYSADFYGGTIDVLKGNAGAPDLGGNFTDPGIPSGYAPFNIENLNGTLYVSYALRDSTGTDDVSGAGHGFVSAFDLQGNFLRRVGTGGTLDSPWGLAIAPASFGEFAGDLLVGNFGDGRIGVFDPLTSVYRGQLLGTDGNPIVIDGLWGLMIGNGGSGGSVQDVYFSAGPDNESHGLLGVIVARPTSVPEPSSLYLIGIALAAFGAATRRKGPYPCAGRAAPV